MNRAALAGLVVSLTTCSSHPSTGPGGATEATAAWARETLPVRLEADSLRQLLAQSPLPPLPTDPTNRVADDPCAAQFGQYLFFETRLSGNGEVACATCHLPEKAFSNGERFGQGLGTTGRHVPHLWNVAYNRWYFWDGRKDTLWSQALGPMEAPPEHGSTRVAYVRTLSEHEDLRSGYEAVFGPLPDVSDERRFPPHARPEPLFPWAKHQVAWAGMHPEDRRAVSTVFANMGKAIAAYERRIISDDSPFDRLVAALRARDPAAASILSEAALRGMRTFSGEGRCLLCHHGPNFTDGEFHDARVARHGGRTDHGRLHGARQLKADRFNVLGAWNDDPTGSTRWKVELLADTPHADEQFKTPSLRNVALTAPYFHHGSHATLEEVVEHYSTFEGAKSLRPDGERILLPLRLSEREGADLVTFLHSLTDAELDPALLTKPESPIGADCRN